MEYDRWIYVKNNKLILNYTNLLTEHIASKGFRPQTPRELAVRLNIIPAHIDPFFDAIKNLEEQKLCTIQKDTGWLLPAKQKNEDDASALYVQGRLSLSPRGFGFVQIEQVDQPASENSILGKIADKDLVGKDVFIPKSFLKEALHRDRVAVHVTGKDHRGYEGSILRVIEHSDQTLYGIIWESLYQNGQKFWKVKIPLMAEQNFVTISDQEALSRGTRVACKTSKSGEVSTGSARLLDVIEVCGHIDNPSEDLEFAMGEYGLSWEFPPDCMAETCDLGSSVSEESMKGRKDLRNLVTLTIDPSTAKDFDDAISIELVQRDGQEQYCLYVHIADVPAYVKEGSALDKEARIRANSTYLPGYCIPMLPPELSNELCSLKPHVPRLAVTTQMFFCSKTGELLSSKTYRSVIKSRHRYSYEEAMKILEELPSKELQSLPELDYDLALMQKLYFLREARRRSGGQISMALDEARLEIDANGMPTAIHRVEYDLSHKLIEEFMVTTNEEIAKKMTEKTLPAIYRVHESPDPKSFEPFKQLIESLGYSFDVENDIEQLQAFFKEMEGTARYSQICLAYIRCMKMAYYSDSNSGHFGLSLQHYCHFTSPIRRYSDLITMRSLFGESSGAGLAKDAQYLSEKERVSAQAEMSVSLLKKWRFLKLELEKGNSEHEAIITKILPFGVIVSLRTFLLEVLIPLQRLSPHYLHLNLGTQELTCDETETVLKVGSALTVKLNRVDLIAKEGEWEVPGNWSEEDKKAARGKRRAFKHQRSANSTKYKDKRSDKSNSGGARKSASKKKKN